ncbi:hypothetical protein EVAR_60057_1 [Eumeta japonica]|uniref:Uncharacterized protein n=1 Tax=Eumeta variegata TaxID=151549 RepID=A0A4C1ZNC4_EUMVA|nr:hypothetical protein EVAR_60057_1 [Eumeta japonica]
MVTLPAYPRIISKHLELGQPGFRVCRGKSDNFPREKVAIFISNNNKTRKTPIQISSNRNPWGPFRQYPCELSMHTITMYEHTSCTLKAPSSRNELLIHENASMRPVAQHWLSNLRLSSND